MEWARVLVAVEIGEARKREEAPREGGVRGAGGKRRPGAVKVERRGRGRGRGRGKVKGMVGESQMR